MDWEALAAQGAGRCLVFAVDVAKHDFVASVQVKDGAALVRVKWQHPAETPAVLAGLARLVAAGPVEAVMESSGTYGDALRWQLRHLGATLYRVSAKRVHDAAEVFDGVPSLHDPKAADIIAELRQLGAQSGLAGAGCAAPRPHRPVEDAAPVQGALSAGISNRLEALLSSALVGGPDAAGARQCDPTPAFIADYGGAGPGARPSKARRAC